MNLYDLRDAVNAGQSFDYLLFWGHRPSKDGRIHSSCLSQWWPARFVVDGVAYATAEHFMMAGKARLFGDDEMLARILEAPSPAAAKKLGRKVRGFDEETWKAHRFDIVRDASAAKFGQDPGLRDYLLGTGDKVLVEASPYDRIWGIGLKAADPRAADPRTWQGQNLLGFALMEARTYLRT
ncbi:MAG: NADAR family protein [Alphaproteobacteria bacterium]|nr:NADAR family protein [Alphaproteobacteria bacterium]